jgi:hypothetical protein
MWVVQLPVLMGALCESYKLFSLINKALSSSQKKGKVNLRVPTVFDAISSYAYTSCSEFQSWDNWSSLLDYTIPERMNRNEREVVRK